MSSLIKLETLRWKLTLLLVDLISNHFLWERENALLFNCNWACAKCLHYNLIYKGLCESVLKQLGSLYIQGRYALEFHCGICSIKCIKKLVTHCKHKDQRDSLIPVCMADVWVCLTRIKCLIIAWLNVIHNYINRYRSLPGH